MKGLILLANITEATIKKYIGSRRKNQEKKIQMAALFKWISNNVCDSALLGEHVTGL